MNAVGRSDFNSIGKERDGLILLIVLIQHHSILGSIKEISII